MRKSIFIVASTAGFAVIGLLFGLVGSLNHVDELAWPVVIGGLGGALLALAALFAEKRNLLPGAPTFGPAPPPLTSQEAGSPTPTEPSRVSDWLPRVARLERQNRWLKLVAGVTVLCAVAALLFGQGVLRHDAPSESQAPGRLNTLVQAQTFRLVDEKGRVRGEWGIRSQDPGFILLDDLGKKRLVLSVEAREPLFGMTDQDGRERIGMGVKRGEPVFGLFNKEVRPLIGCSTGPEGSALFLCDGLARRRLSLTVSGEGEPGLMFTDANKRTQVQLAGRAVGPSLVLMGENSKPRVALAARSDGPALIVSDDQGKPVLSKP